MSIRKTRLSETTRNVPKSPTGIQGLDEITGGGLPRGRPTLICGGPGCGKTILAMEFLINGAHHYDEPGVFVSKRTEMASSGCRRMVIMLPFRRS